MFKCRRGQRIELERNGKVYHTQMEDRATEHIVPELYGIG